MHVQVRIQDATPTAMARITVVTELSNAPPNALRWLMGPLLTSASGRPMFSRPVNSFVQLFDADIA